MLRRGCVTALACIAFACTGCGRDDSTGSDARDDGWRLAAPGPVDRVEAPAAVVDGLLYVLGGFGEGGKLRSHARCDVYDPAADRWRRLADMPLEVTHVNAVVEGERIWVAGGFVGNHPGRPTDRSFVYDTAADAWSEGPPLPAPRAGGGLVRIGRFLHYFGGFSHDRNTTYEDHWRLNLDAAPRWEPRAPMPEARGHHAAVVFEGRAYALGGQFNHDQKRRDVAFVHVYDPVADVWHERAPMPTPRSHAEGSTFAHGGRLFVVGGRDTSSRRTSRGQGSGNQAVADVTVYDPETDRWSEHGTLPHPLLGPAAAVIGGRLIVTSGSTRNSRAPQRDTWISGLRMRRARDAGPGD